MALRKIVGDSLSLALPPNEEHTKSISIDAAVVVQAIRNEIESAKSVAS